MDLVIRGGTLVDGTGAPGRVADVGVVGGRIAEIGSRLRGGRELDASGQVVAPGFVDVHTHYDAQVFWDPGLTPSSDHGVTSVVAGNCGFGLAPVRPEARALMASTLRQVEDMSYDTLMAGVPWDEFETFPQYLDAVEQRGVGINFSCYVGHTAVRLHVMGDDAYERAATADEIVRMQETVADALAAGAIGFASSWGEAHNGDRGRPVPSRRADLPELRALLLPLRDARRGVVAIARGQGLSEDEMIALQREIGRPLTWTALLTRTSDPEQHRGAVARNDAATAEGADVWPQVACRPVVFRFNLADPAILNLREPFRALVAGTRSERVAKYHDPSWRAATLDVLSTGEGRLPPYDWAPLSVAESDAHPELVGSSVTALAAERGCSPLDVVLDLSLEDDLRTRFGSVVANDDADGIGWLLQREHLLLGLADSGAHVSQLCDACFATDLLGHWVRERGTLPLERAVHKLTGEPAAVFGLRDRGTVEVGKAADLCVFDPDEVAPGPMRRVRDFPADGERLTADAPRGITHVVVNGVTIRVDGAPDADGLAARPGEVLRTPA